MTESRRKAIHAEIWARVLDRVLMPEQMITTMILVTGGLLVDLYNVIEGFGGLGWSAGVVTGPIITTYARESLRWRRHNRRLQRSLDEMIKDANTWSY